MKKKIIIFIVILALFIMIAFSYFIFVKRDNTERISVEGIENFQPIKENGETYLLFYPADSRISQEYTLVREVRKTGETVREYEIKDDDIGRMDIHQKPNDMNQVYISFFGDKAIDNYYFTYDVHSTKFKKVNLDYFDYMVGVNHIFHYGDDVLFGTLVSHKTGEQNANSNGDFNMSISNYSKKKSFETPYKGSPSWTALLEFNDKIIYGTSGVVNEKDKSDYIGIGIVDMMGQTVEFRHPSKRGDLTPIYATERYAYILSEFGQVYVYDKDFQMSTYEPFKDIRNVDEYYRQENKPLLVDKNRALHTIYNQDGEEIVGIFTFEPEISFQPLKKEYIKSNYDYRFLYQDLTKKELYMIKENDKESSLLIIDQDFNIQAEIPIEYSHLLDFVVKN